jgi:hypothetical protein
VTALSQLLMFSGNSFSTEDKCANGVRSFADLKRHTKHTCTGSLAFRCLSEAVYVRDVVQLKTSLR